MRIVFGILRAATQVGRGQECRMPTVEACDGDQLKRVMVKLQSCNGYGLSVCLRLMAVRCDLAFCCGFFQIKKG